jgi:hypothetical protein
MWPVPGVRRWSGEEHSTPEPEVHWTQRLEVRWTLEREELKIRQLAQPRTRVPGQGRLCLFRVSEWSKRSWRCGLKAGRTQAKVRGEISVNVGVSCAALGLCTVPDAVFEVGLAAQTSLVIGTAALEGVEAASDISSTLGLVEESVRSSHGSWIESTTHNTRRDDVLSRDGEQLQGAQSTDDGKKASHGEGELSSGRPRRRK